MFTNVVRLAKIISNFKYLKAFSKTNMREIDTEVGTE